MTASVSDKSANISIYTSDDYYYAEVILDDHREITGPYDSLLDAKCGILVLLSHLRKERKATALRRKQHSHKQPGTNIYLLPSRIR